MVDAGEGADEGFFDDRKFAEREVAFVELAVEEAFHDEVVDGGLDATLGGFLDGSDGGFAAVAERSSRVHADFSQGIGSRANELL